MFVIEVKQYFNCACVSKTKCRLRCNCHRFNPGVGRRRTKPNTFKSFDFPSTQTNRFRLFTVKTELYEELNEFKALRCSGLSDSVVKQLLGEKVYVFFAQIESKKKKKKDFVGVDVAQTTPLLFELVEYSTERIDGCPMNSDFVRVIKAEIIT